MKSDMDEFMKSAKTSLVNILAREAERQPATHPKPARKISYQYIIGGIIVIAVIGISAFLLRSGEETPAPQRLVPPAPFFATETSRTITARTGDRQTLKALLEDSARERERPGTIKRILIKLQDGARERFATLTDLLELYDITPPPTFLDLIQPPLMTVFFRGREESRFGFVVQSNDPDRTLGIMLSWESSLLYDFRPFLFDEKPQVVLGPFEDRTYRNIDWRYLKLSQEKDIGIGYGIFPGGKNVVVATSKESMEKMIDRLFEAR